MGLLPNRHRGDIWAAPPGGLPPAARRSHLKSGIAFVVVVALSIGGSLTYASMKKSTAVSAEDALAEFAAATETDDEAAKEQSSEADATARKQRSQKGARRGGQSNKERTVAAPSTSQAGPPRRANKTGGGPEAAAAPNDRPKPAARTKPAPPEDGVYAWSIDGYEQAPGIRRDLPSRSHRVITHDGENAWTEHHIFSEQREQWMNVAVSPEGVMARSVRNRVEMGPVVVDNTIIFNPVMFVARYPSKVGQTWRGSWSGKTSGTYTARTFEKTTVVIEGEEIEVYASEVIMDMRGEVEGRAITRSWYSLEHGMVVKQYQKMDVKSGPGNYRSEWSGQVLSLEPRR